MRHSFPNDGPANRHSAEAVRHSIELLVVNIMETPCARVSASTRGRCRPLWVLISLVVIAGCSTQKVSADELDRIIEVLDLKTDSVVADVGAGDGEWTVKLAQRIGDRGHVWATEVESDDVEDLEKRALDALLNNVTVVLGDQFDTGLPDDCCDAILLRMVYHHFINPERMRASLQRSLRPGGLIAVIDITPQSAWRDLADVPDRGGHGIPLEDLIREMTLDGFQVVLQEDDWNGDEDRYCVVFRR